MLRWVSFKVLLHFISKFKPFDKCFPFQNVIANLPPCLWSYVWRFFQILLQNYKGLLRGFPSLNRLTWNFKPFNKCFLSQTVTANFSLMLLQFSPCVWKARKVSRLARKVKDVFRFVDHLFKYELSSPGLDSQKDF